MKYYRQHPEAFPGDYLTTLRGEISACSYFSTNNLNRDFVGTKGFSVVFWRSHIPQVTERFPYFKPYLDQALLPECNAFYLNPLQLTQGSRVDPHIDRSLRSYCKTVDPPLVVSVLYVVVPPNLQGGELVLRRDRQSIAQVKPRSNTLLYFQGDLTHSVNAVTAGGTRLSLVCEQYNLTDAELQQVPTFTIESRVSQPKTTRSKASSKTGLKKS